MGTFLAQLEPADNPNQLSSGLSASQQNGQALFLANCAVLPRRHGHDRQRLPRRRHPGDR